MASVLLFVALSSTVNSPYCNGLLTHGGIRIIEPEAEVVDSEDIHSGNLARPVTPSAGDLHHIAVSVIYCIDQC